MTGEPMRADERRRLLERARVLMAAIDADLEELRDWAERRRWERATGAESRTNGIDVPQGAASVAGAAVSAFVGSLWDSLKLWDNAEVALDYRNARAADSGVAGSVYTAAGSTVAKVVGLTNLVNAVEGRSKEGDPLSVGQRLVEGVVGSVVVAGTATGLAATGKAASAGMRSLRQIRPHVAEAVANSAVSSSALLSSTTVRSGPSGSIGKAALVEGHEGVTRQSTRIASGIRSGDVGVNILGDDLFERAWTLKGGRGSAPQAFASGEQAYLRRSSSNLLSDTLHEGTHSLDYLRGFSGSTYHWEMRAYYYERQFQLSKGGPVDFPTLSEMLTHIKDNY